MMKSLKANSQEQIANSHFVYILRCADGTLYTGKTIDLEARLLVHNSGKGAKYTRSKLPVELVYSEEYKTNREAAQRECEIKKLSKAQKEELITSNLDDGNG